jgi:ABC-type phosphonate transport system ATPase subunit
MDYLEFISRVTSHIPDKGQVMVRYYGLYANVHRGKVKMLRIVEEEVRRLPSKGWAVLIRKPHIGLRSAALMNRSRFMRTAKRGPHEPKPVHEDCQALP